MKKSKKITLVIIPAIILAACDNDAPLHRDVYTSAEECVADWANSELCAQMPPDAAQEYTTASHANNIASGSHATGIGDGISTMEDNAIVGNNNTNNDHHGSANPVFVPNAFFWGPNYSSGTRSVDYNGTTYTPLTNTHARAPFNVSTSAISAAKVSPGAVRSGWGGTARGIGGAVGS